MAKKYKLKFRNLKNTGLMGFVMQPISNNMSKFQVKRFVCLQLLLTQQLRNMYNLAKTGGRPMVLTGWRSKGGNSEDSEGVKVKGNQVRVRQNKSLQFCKFIMQFFYNQRFFCFICIFSNSEGEPQSLFSMHLMPAVGISLFYLSSFALLQNKTMINWSLPYSLLKISYEL